MATTRYPNSQANPASAVPVWLAPPPSGSGLTLANISTDGDNALKEGPGTFLGLTVNTAGEASSAEVYDGTDDGGVLLGTIDTTVRGPFFPGPGWPFTTGLFIKTASTDPAADITVSYF